MQEWSIAPTGCRIGNKKSAKNIQRIKTKFNIIIQRMNFQLKIGSKEEGTALIKELHEMTDNDGHVLEDLKISYLEAGGPKLSVT
jgi:hypothetical protein